VLLSGSVAEEPEILTLPNDGCRAMRVTRSHDLGVAFIDGLLLERSWVGAHVVRDIAMRSVTLDFAVDKFSSGAMRDGVRAQKQQRV
jgi:hypothetical protein